MREKNAIYIIFLFPPILLSLLYSLSTCTVSGVVQGIWVYREEYSVLILIFVCMCVSVPNEEY